MVAGYFFAERGLEGWVCGEVDEEEAEDGAGDVDVCEEDFVEGLHVLGEYHQETQ